MQNQLQSMNNNVSYSIIEGLDLIKENNIYYVDTKEELIKLYEVMDDNSNYISCSFNNKYIVIWEMDYECPIISAIAAYDIEKKKIIDCSNNYTNNQLVDNVVKRRRCMYDVIASILLDEELMNDKSRLYSFMSFIVNKSVDENNFHKYTPIIREYVINNYPELRDQKIHTSRKDLCILNQQYGLDYFVFNKKAYNIEGLRYIKSSEKKKTKKKTLYS